MLTRTQAIKNMLEKLTFPDLANLYHYGMEVQVNVAQDHGHRIEGEFRGKNWIGYTDGLQTWKSFRIPYKANTDPEYEDIEMKFDLAEHAEGIGMTGWNWQEKTSVWVGFDFDAITGHKHEKKLSQTELDEVRDKVMDLDWVEIRQSTSGKGLHLYVFLEPTETANHNEHAALARCVLSHMSMQTGFDFSAKVDACGAVLWQWHRKMLGTEGLSIIKKATSRLTPPDNWQDHVAVITGSRKKIKPFGNIDEYDFETLCAKQTRVPIDEEHQKLIDWLIQNQKQAWWSNDHWALVCHSYDIKLAHEQLGLRGIYDTNSTGKEMGKDHNMFMFPLRRGAWVARRFTPGTSEHLSWEQDGSGWTKIYVNRDPTFEIAAKAHEGVELVKGGFSFTAAENAMLAANLLGANVNLPHLILNRKAILKRHKDGRLIFEIDRDPQDNPLQNWNVEAKKWVKIFNIKLNDPNEQDIVGQYDDFIRHLVTQEGNDCGWAIKADGVWRNEPLTHVKHALASLGYADKDIKLIIGACTLQCWTIVNKPFQDEYPLGREWNRNAPQFRFSRSQEVDTLSYPTWERILHHCGHGLTSSIRQNEWCKMNGIVTGGEYLKCWIASMFQEPSEPLPYLFFYGDQMAGKSVFHEAISLLVTHGVVRADTALTSDFNGELANAILCVVEETDLQRNVKAANKIKDLVTSKELLIHAKTLTPFTIPNTTHWVQCSNSHQACPIFPGDTRITMIEVPKIKNPIQKKQLFIQLEKEAPDFLSELLNLELPSSPDRLNLPIIETAAKRLVEAANRSHLDEFLTSMIHHSPGECIKFSEFYDTFIEWLDESDRAIWNKNKVSRELKPQFPKGRSSRHNGAHFIGNVSFNPPEKESEEFYIVENEFLKLVKEEKESDIFRS